jgi:hypothetical protein
MSENRSVGSTFGPTRSTCEWNHCWRNISENRSFGSTFCSTRSTCELNHLWRNMSENRTWWNQLPVEGTASHPTITSRALPMMWPIIHQCSIWEALMNQFWMNITEWPRFLHPLVGYPLNSPLSPSHYGRMVDAQLNALVSWTFWLAMIYEHDEKVFHIHMSFILHGVLVGAGSLWLRFHMEVHY